MSRLDAHCVATLRAMARRLFPHDALEDGPYARVVEAIAVSADDARIALLVDGVHRLDTTAGERFIDVSPERQVEVLTQIEGTEFFEDVRSAVVRSLYSDAQVWAKFGYEGPSAHLGGYATRGLDDAAWIPEE